MDLNRLLQLLLVIQTARLTRSKGGYTSSVAQLLPYHPTMPPSTSRVQQHQRGRPAPQEIHVTNITACLLIERGNPHLLYDYNEAAAGMDLAVTYVNENILPPTYRLQTLYMDIGNSCTTKSEIITYAMLLWERGVDCAVYIGPGCGIAAENLYSFAEFFQRAIIGCPAADVGIHAPSKEYTLLLRISISFAMTAKIMFRFFDEFNYTSLAFFTDTSDLFYGPMGNIVQISLNDDRHDLSYTSKFEEFDGTVSTREDYRTLLIDAHKYSRVHIILGDSGVVRNFLKEADQLGYTDGNTVFLAVVMFEDPQWGSFSWHNKDDFDSTALHAYQNLAILGLQDAVSNVMDVFQRDIIHNSKRDYNYTFNGTTGRLNPIITHFYDAIVLYGSIVNDLIELMDPRIDYRNGAAIGAWGENYSFLSPLNGFVQLDDDGDRQMTYVVKTMNPSTGKYQVVLQFAPDGTVSQLGSTLSWPGSETGEMPLNEPECGYKEDRCPRKVRRITKGEITGAVCGSLAILFIFFGFLFRAQRQLNQMSDPFWWKIFVGDIYLPGEAGTGGVSGKSMLDTSESAVPLVTATKDKVEEEDDGSTSDTEEEEVPEKPEVLKLAFYNGASVTLQVLPEPKFRASPAIVNEAASIRQLEHANLQKIIGIAINDDNLCDYLVGEACHKGSLTDVILDPAGTRLDWPFKHSLIKDIVAGMVYLHGTKIASFGWLTSHSCLIDSRLVAKICDYGFTLFRKQEDLDPPLPERPERDFELLLWRAPEHLRHEMPRRGSQKGDVYSFAVILQQIFLRSMPYRSASYQPVKGEQFKAMEITLEVKSGATPPLRPRVPVSAVTTELYDLMESCWEEVPLNRPTFPRIRVLLKAILGQSGDNIVEHLIRSLDEQARDLEKKMDSHVKMFLEEKNRTTNLLINILPKTVFDALNKGEVAPPETFKSASVHVTDISNFSETVRDLSPADTINTLNRLYTILDGIVETSDICLLETTVDNTMMVSGIPKPNGGRHGFEICLAALAMRREIAKLVVNPAMPARRLKFRSGIHSGPCVAAVIGLKLPKYCVFGETVYIAVQLRITGEGGRINISEATKTLLDQVGGFPTTERGPMRLKGRAEFPTHWLDGIS